MSFQIAVMSVGYVTPAADTGLALSPSSSALASSFISDLFQWTAHGLPPPAPRSALVNTPCREGQPRSPSLTGLCFVSAEVSLPRPQLPESPFLLRYLCNWCRTGVSLQPIQCGDGGSLALQRAWLCFPGLCSWLENVQVFLSSGS